MAKLYVASTFGGSTDFFGILNLDLELFLAESGLWLKKFVGEADRLFSSSSQGLFWRRSGTVFLAAPD